MNKLFRRRIIYLKVLTIGAYSSVLISGGYILIIISYLLTGNKINYNYDFGTIKLGFEELWVALSLSFWGINLYPLFKYRVNKILLFTLPLLALCTSIFFLHTVRFYLYYDFNINPHHIFGLYNIVIGIFLGLLIKLEIRLTVIFSILFLLIYLSSIYLSKMLIIYAEWPKYLWSSIIQPVNHSYYLSFKIFLKNLQMIGLWFFFSLLSMSLIWIVLRYKSRGLTIAYHTTSFGVGRLILEEGYRIWSRTPALYGRGIYFWQLKKDAHSYGETAYSGNYDIVAEELPIKLNNCLKYDLPIPILDPNAATQISHELIKLGIDVLIIPNPFIEDTTHSAKGDAYCYLKMPTEY
jgi:hypothetical protein